MSSLRKLTADLTQAGQKIQRVAFKAQQVEAHKMKQDWGQRVAGARNLEGLAAAVSYDVEQAGTSITAEVGYTDQGQGELGNIAEFGTSTQGPKRPAGLPVLEAGADRLVAYLSRMDPL